MIRVGEDGELCDSTPCKHCTMAMKDIGIKKVAFSQKDGTITEVRTKDIDSDTIEFSSGYRQLERDIITLDTSHALSVS